MSSLSATDIVTIFLSLGILLAAARICGEIARKLNQPVVLGELLAGVILGPTALGSLFPVLMERLFPTTGPVGVFLGGFVTVAVAMFLLVAGLEVDLSMIWRQGRPAMIVSVAGLAAPFTIGLLAGGLLPDVFGREPGASRLIFALFLATALSISALPVIAKTLIDLNIYRSELGMTVITAAVIDDLTGWICFAIILSLMGPGLHNGGSVAFTVAATIGFVVLVLTGGRWAVHRSLPWIQAHSAWPGGVLSFALALALLGAAFTEWIGVHAVFGAFLVGVAIGDSSHLREQTRTVLHQFVSFIFAPLFFASVGLKLDFAGHFDLSLTLAVLAIAMVGKVVGCGLGARIGGMPKREAWAVGFAMNARGAMEIILGLLALQNGIIGNAMFVSLVIMAIVTSLVSGPAMRKILRLRNPRRLDRFITVKTFRTPLAATSPREAIRELSQSAAYSAGLDPSVVEKAAWRRETQGPTGIGSQIAVPHARLEGLKAPVVAVGLSPHGVDFNAPDGEPARIIFLLLTPRDDDGAQVEILADIARKFRDESIRQKALEVGGFTEFLALLRTSTEH